MNNSGSSGAGTPAVRVRAEVVENRNEGPAQWRLTLAVPDWPGSLPGQFAMLSPGACGAAARSDPLLPRPMAVYRSRRSASATEVEFVYKVEGRGTALLSEATRGQRVHLLGPLGRGFSDSGGLRAVLVGGGTGIASLYELAERCADESAPDRGPLIVLAGRCVSDLLGRSDFEKLSADLRIVTEDGSAGVQGLATDLLETLLDEESGVRVYACGPTAMMRRCAEIAAARGVPCSVSLENPMACGFGVCLGCAAPLAAGGYALVCRDGPVFEAEEISWEGLA